MEQECEAVEEVEDGDVWDEDEEKGWRWGTRRRSWRRSGRYRGVGGGGAGEVGRVGRNCVKIVCELQAA